MKRSPVVVVLMLCAILIQVASAAWAEDVQVRYLVDPNEFKAAVAGTPLSFELYSDGACTSLVGSQTINAEDVDLVEVLKVQKVKGDTSPQAKTARIQQMLTGAAAAAAYYAKVTGTGVVPVGGPCQFQSNAAGSSANVPGTLVARDGSGNFSAGTMTGNVDGTLNGVAMAAGTLVAFSPSLPLEGESGAGAGYTYSCVRDNGYVTSACTCTVTFTPSFFSGTPTALIVPGSGSVSSFVSATNLIIPFQDGQTPLNFLLAGPR